MYKKWKTIHSLRFITGLTPLEKELIHGDLKKTNFKILRVKTLTLGISHIFGQFFYILDNLNKPQTTALAKRNTLK